MGRSPFEGHDLTGRALDGRYRLLRRLGAGGMGTVYLAEHVALGNEVAVKVLRSDLAAADRHRKRFLREARAASRIKNDRVVSITDFGMTGDGIVYFVMEYIAGENLEVSLRREGARPWSEAKPIIVQIATAVAAAHAEGIIHRDIKPSNCMIYDDGSGRPAVKVLDFGLAKLTGEGAGSLDVTSTDELFGTVAYMAPELTQGKKADQRTDIYAVGVLLYRMLSGELPFRGETAFQVLTHHVNTAPPPLQDTAPGLLPGVEGCVLQAMAKDPAQRFASVDDMRAALLAIPEQPPIVATAQLVLGSGGAVDDATESMRVPATQGDAGRAANRKTSLAIAIAAGIGVTVLAAWALFAAREHPDEPKAEVASVIEDATPRAEPARSEPPPMVQESPATAEPPPPPVEAPPPPPAAEPIPVAPVRAGKPPRPPRTREPATDAPSDANVTARLAAAVKSKCRGQGPPGHVTIRSAVGSDGRVLSVTATGGNDEQRACAKALAKRREFKPGSTRVVKTEADL